MFWMVSLIQTEEPFPSPVLLTCEVLAELSFQFLTFLKCLLGLILSQPLIPLSVNNTAR